MCRTEDQRRKEGLRLTNDDLESLSEWVVQDGLEKDSTKARPRVLLRDVHRYSCHAVQEAGLVHTEVVGARSTHC